MYIYMCVYYVCGCVCINSWISRNLHMLPWLCLQIAIPAISRQGLTKPMGFPSRLHTLEEAPWTDWFSPWTCWGIQSSSWKKKLWVPTTFYAYIIYTYIYIYDGKTNVFLHTFKIPSFTAADPTLLPKIGSLWKLTRFETKQWLRRMIFIVDMAMKFCFNGLVFTGKS